MLFSRRRLAYNGARVFHGSGTVWYRLVGVDLLRGNLTADAESSVRFVAGQLNMDLAFGSFVQVVAPNSSVAPGVTPYTDDGHSSSDAACEKGGAHGFMHASYADREVTSGHGRQE